MKQDMPIEQKLEHGASELDVLRGIFSRWLKSDFDWAVNNIIQQGRSGEEDEWDFMRLDWIGKYEEWLYPYVMRLFQTEYITGEQRREFNDWAYEQMALMLTALYNLEVVDE